MQLKKYIDGIVNIAVRIRLSRSLVNEDSQIELVKFRTQMFESRTQLIHLVQCLSDKELNKKDKYKGNSSVRERLMLQAKRLTEKIEEMDQLIL